MSILPKSTGVFLVAGIAFGGLACTSGFSAQTPTQQTTFSATNNHQSSTDRNAAITDVKGNGGNSDASDGDGSGSISSQNSGTDANNSDSTSGNDQSGGSGTSATGDNATSSDQTNPGDPDVISSNASHCSYRAKKSCQVSVPGFPLPFDACAMLRSGAMTKDGDRLVGTKNVFYVHDRPYLDLDQAERSVEFQTQHYEIALENADSQDCELVSALDGTTPDVRKGCFLETTNIRMSDGSNKIAKDIHRGDLVFNPVTHKPGIVTEIVRGKETKAGMLEVGTSEGLVVVTATHPFMTNFGLRQAQALTKADRILGQKGVFLAIRHLVQRPLDPEVRVFNFVINQPGDDVKDHMVLADGVITGDLYIQKLLEDQRPKARRFTAQLTELDR